MKFGDLSRFDFLNGNDLLLGMLWVIICIIDYKGYRSMFCRMLRLIVIREMIR